MTQRAFTRIAMQMPARVQAGERVFEAQVQNLALHGVLLQTSQRLRPGEQVQVQLQPPGEGLPAIQGLGEVIRCDGRGLAIDFRLLDNRSFNLLRRLLATCAKDGRSIEQELSEYLSRIS